MNTIDHIRAKTLSAPSCTFMLGDPVICRRGPLDHEFSARVVGRTLGVKPVYDVETADGTRLMGVVLVRLDEEVANLARIAEGLEQ